MLREREAQDQRPSTLVIGVTGNAGTEGHDAKSSASGQDACIGKPLPGNFDVWLVYRISYIVIRRMDGAPSGQADTCPLT
eukprot:4299990-Prymnesium_polylepis.1